MIPYDSDPLPASVARLGSQRLAVEGAITDATNKLFRRFSEHSTTPLTTAESRTIAHLEEANNGARLRVSARKLNLADRPVLVAETGVYINNIVLVDVFHDSIHEAANPAQRIITVLFEQNQISAVVRVGYDGSSGFSQYGAQYEQPSEQILYQPYVRKRDLYTTEGYVGRTSRYERPPDDLSEDIAKRTLEELGLVFFVDDALRKATGSGFETKAREDLSGQIERWKNINTGPIQMHPGIAELLSPMAREPFESVVVFPGKTS